MNYSFLYFRKSFKMLQYNFKFLYILTGLYTFIVEKCGTDVVMKSRRKIYSVLYITVVSLLMAASVIQRFALVDANDGFFKVLFSCLISCTNLMGQVTMFSFAYKVDTYVVLLNRMDEFDKKLKQLHVVVWNTVPFWSIVCHIVVIPFAFFTIYIADRSLEKKLLDAFAIYVPVITKSLMLCILITMLLFLWQRCHGINLLLEELDDELIDDNISDRIMNAGNNLKIASEQQATDILMKVTVLLEQLVEFTEIIKDVFSVIIFINFAFLILVISAVVVMFMYHRFVMTELSLMEYLLMILFYTAQTLVVYVLCFLLETETRNIYITVGQLNIYYLTLKLAFMKNTLLLQGLHNKINMNLYGIIRLRPSVFLKQLDVCKTIILLLIQYYRKSPHAV